RIAPFFFSGAGTISSIFFCRSATSAAVAALAVSLDNSGAAAAARQQTPAAITMAPAIRRNFAVTNVSLLGGGSPRRVGQRLVGVLLPGSGQWTVGGGQSAIQNSSGSGQAVGTTKILPSPIRPVRAARGTFSPSAA